MVKLWLKQSIHARNKHRYHSQILRLLRYRLIIPLRRSMDNPKLLARGVAVGLLIGFTPTVGVQMIMALLFWMFSRRFLGWDFNLILAIAWTYFSNPLTMIPLYYIFYLTGCLMTGTSGDYSFTDFARVMEQVTQTGGDHFWTVAWKFLEDLWANFGIRIFLGSAPWSLGLSILGYVGVMRYFNGRRRPGNRIGAQDPA